MNPACFVIMPFGKKNRITGELIDFDRVYSELIEPAILEAGMDPIRADMEESGGIIHKPMFERLVLCDFAVVDLTTANPNVFYELGVRHAARPFSTVAIFEKQESLPFDLNLLRSLPYDLNELRSYVESLKGKLVYAREGQCDSPVFQLIEGMPHPTLPPEVREKLASYTTRHRGLISKIRDAERKGTKFIHEIEETLPPIKTLEASLAIRLCIAYRTACDWLNIIRVIRSMSRFLYATPFIQELLAFALNRNCEGREAEQVLLSLIKERGGTSEQYGLLGRVYKDRWKGALATGNIYLAKGAAEQAIKTYTIGFEIDPRDYYPGINALTLMEVNTPGCKEFDRLLPVVEYAVIRSFKFSERNYWNVATQFELEILKNSSDAALNLFHEMLTLIQDPWQVETTLDTVTLIVHARTAAGVDVEWLRALALEMEKHCNVS